MPRKRNKQDAGLPTRWKQKHGAYYYRVPPDQEHQWDGKQWFRLGTTLSAAYKVWAERMEVLDDIRLIDDLLDRYALQVVPDKAPKTREENARAIKKLKAVFGKMPLTAIRPKHIYMYYDKREAKTAAKREIEVIRHAFTKAVQWGLIDQHPFKGQVELEGSSPRGRYVRDDELIAALSLQSVRKKGSVLAVQAYIRVKLLTGLRRGDLLRLRLTDCTNDGIEVRPNKTAHTTGKALVIQWSDELRSAVQTARQVRPVDISPYLFCTRDGKSYYNEATGKANGWDSMWQRFMKRVLAETDVSERFTEHDLRAKCASDAETLEHARALLAHADARTTDRWYRRKPEVVRPLR